VRSEISASIEEAQAVYINIGLNSDIHLSSAPPHKVPIVLEPIGPAMFRLSIRDVQLLFLTRESSEPSLAGIPLQYYC
jgi:hypothetical protein